MQSDEPTELVFAQVEYPGEYRDAHAELVAFVKRHFRDVKSGLQSDSWIWIMDGDDKVAIDTFSSRKHQVKSYSSGVHIQDVIDALRIQYEVQVFDKPFES